MGKRIVLLSGTTLFALMLTFAGCGKRRSQLHLPRRRQRLLQQRQRRQNRRHLVVK